MISRYAIYYAPSEDSPLCQLASRWLGRDALTGAALQIPALKPFTDSETLDFTAFPRLYGFHATLKAPFHLKEGKRVDDLMAATEGLAQGCRPFELSLLELTLIGNFIALTFVDPCPPMQELADATVRELDEFRQPLDSAELERRGKGVTARQNELLHEWGYPYVLDEWQFHMSLASKLDSPEVARELLRELKRLFAPCLGTHELVDSVCLFTQPDRGEPFTLTRRFRFAAG